MTQEQLTTLLTTIGPVLLLCLIAFIILKASRRKKEKQDNEETRKYLADLPQRRKNQCCLCCGSKNLSFQIVTEERTTKRKVHYFTNQREPITFNTVYAICQDCGNQQEAL